MKGRAGRHARRTRKAGEKAFLTLIGWEKFAGAALRLIVTSMWGDMTMLPTRSVSVGAVGGVCGEMLGEDIDKGSEAVVAAKARAGKRSCVGKAGTLWYRSIVDMAEKGIGVLQLSEDARGSVSPEASRSSRLLQRSGKGARLACCGTVSEGVLSPT